MSAWTNKGIKEWIKEAVYKTNETINIQMCIDHLFALVFAINSSVTGGGKR